MTDGVVPRTARLALVGDRSPDVQAHVRLPDILARLESSGALDVQWIRTTQASTADFGSFDGIWALPGSPYEDREGMFAAIRFARTNGTPFLGTCGGFQHMLLEWAQDVCGLDVEHAEDGSGDRDALIRPLACSLLGEARTVHPISGTRGETILGQGPRIERYFCSYGLDQQFEWTLVASGLVVLARDDDGDVRLAEWPSPSHPFFVGALFQPELSSSREWVHPLIESFAEAVRAHALAGSPTS